MKTSFKIQVNHPCGENFSVFKPTPNGGLCTQCQKEVIDFTGMSDKELVDVLRNNVKNTCGRFKASQLKRPITNSNPSWIQRGVGFATLSLLLLAVTPKLEAQILEPNNPNAMLVSAQQKYVIKGKVVDEDNLPLPHVNVVLKGSNLGVVTDFDGEFEFSQALLPGDVLLFSYLGYDPKEFTVEDSELEVIDVTIQFNPSDVILMGEVAVETLYTSKGQSKKRSKAPR